MACAHAEIGRRLPHAVSVPAQRAEIFTATKKPLGELAWDYFLNQPTARRMHRQAQDRDSLDHLQANLLKGMEENLRLAGPAIGGQPLRGITLSFDSQGEKPKRPWIEGWRCVYDMKTGTFSVPPNSPRTMPEPCKAPGPHTGQAL